MLHQLIFQHRNSQRAASAVSFRNVAPSNQTGTVCLALEAIHEGLQVGIEIAPVLLPRHLIDSRRSLPVQVVETPSQEFFIQKGVHPSESVSFADPRSVRYTGKHSLHMSFGLSVPHVY